MTNGPGSADPFEKAFREMGNATLAGLATGALVGGARRADRDARQRDRG